MLCVECGTEMRFTNEPMTETFKGMEFSIEGISRYVCDSCGNDEMDAKEAERLSRELANRYATAQGLLSPDEIRSFRKRIGLSKRDFEKLLKVSSPTVSRWETGAMQQSRQADELMRVYSKYPPVLEDAMERAEIHRVPKKSSIEFPANGWHASQGFKSSSPKVNVETSRTNRPTSLVTTSLTVDSVMP